MFDNAKKLSSGFYDIEIWLKRECNKPKKKMESKSTIYKILDQSGNESLLENLQLWDQLFLERFCKNSTRTQITIDLNKINCLKCCSASKVTSDNLCRLVVNISCLECFFVLFVVHSCKKEDWEDSNSLFGRATCSWL